MEGYWLCVNACQNDPAESWRGQECCGEASTAGCSVYILCNQEASPLHVVANAIHNRILLCYSCFWCGTLIAPKIQPVGNRDIRVDNRGSSASFTFIPCPRLAVVDSQGSWHASLSIPLVFSITSPKAILSMRQLQQTYFWIDDINMLCSVSLLLMLPISSLPFPSTLPIAHHQIQQLLTAANVPSFLPTPCACRSVTPWTLPPTPPLLPVCWSSLSRGLQPAPPPSSPSTKPFQWHSQ